MDLKSYVSAQRGKAAELAGALGVSPVLVSQWASGVRQIPAERCPAIERATGGAVRCEELRPDVAWEVLRAAAAAAPAPAGEELASAPSPDRAVANGDEGQPHTPIALGYDARVPGAPPREQLELAGVERTPRQRCDDHPGAAGRERRG